MFEANNSAAAAADLNVTPASLPRQLLQTHSYLTILQGDQDWYKWTAPQTGTMSVGILFSQSVGDLDLFLYEGPPSQLKQLAKSNSQTNNEQLGSEVTAGKTYYIQVLGFTAATQAGYEMLVMGSRYTFDSLEGESGNDTRQTATDLGSGNQIHKGLTIHNTGNEDWYKITPSVSGTMRVDVLFADAQGDLDLH